MRNVVWTTSIPTSLDRQWRNPSRRTAHSCLKKTLSTDVFLVSIEGTRGKSLAALRKVESFVGSIRTCQRQDISAHALVRYGILSK
jgi:hypothetical protein